MTVFVRVSCISRRTVTRWYMIDHLTSCCWSTCSRAGIFAFVSQTSSVIRTVGIYDTLGPAGLVWVAEITNIANTSCCSASRNLTSCVCSTRSWITWIFCSLRCKMTCCKWISCETVFAGTHRAVQPYSAHCVYSTWSRTWVFTFVVDTCSVRRTFITWGTFATTLWRNAFKRWLTWTCLWCAVSWRIAYTVGTTWRRDARVRYGFFYYLNWK